MKKLSLITLFISASCFAQTTTPLPSKVFSDDPYCFIVGFPWPDQNGSVLMIRSLGRTHDFSLRDLDITPQQHMTSAGYDWYINAIGMFSGGRVLSEDKTPWIHIFCFRHKDGREILLDTHTGERLDKKEIELDLSMLRRDFASRVAGLMGSPDPRDRETGAIHAGHLRMTNELSKLKGLLLDESYSVRIDQGAPTKVYYVKEAAEQAIQKITQEQAQDE